MDIEDFKHAMHLVDTVRNSDYELKSEKVDYLDEDDSFCLYKGEDEKHYFVDSFEVLGFLRAKKKYTQKQTPRHATLCRPRVPISKLSDDIKHTIDFLGANV